MITERVETRIEIEEDGVIFIQTDRVILEDDKELTRLHKRKAIPPGNDVTSEPRRVQDISRVIWTPELIAAYQEKIRQILVAATGVV